MGMALQALLHTFGGSYIKDFFSGLLLGMSMAELLVAAYIIIRNLAGR